MKQTEFRILLQPKKLIILCLFSRISYALVWNIAALFKEHFTDLFSRLKRFEYCNPISARIYYTKLIRGDQQKIDEMR